MKETYSMIATAMRAESTKHNAASQPRGISNGARKVHTVLTAPKRRMTAAGFALASLLLPIGPAAFAQDATYGEFATPLVFQAAGPNADSIRGTVTAFRAVPGLETLNGNNPGPLSSGRREINWDGGNPNLLDTSAPVTPFNTFLNTRGGQFTTPGLGLSQAPPSGGLQGGLEVLFNNRSYGTIFKAFSASRLFTSVGSNKTETLFFIPGTNGAVPAAVRGFGVVFTDVDLPDGTGPGAKRGNRWSSTLVEYYDRFGRLVFSSFVPPSPGDGGQSFLGIVFDDARIARVRITAGNVAPGPDDAGRKDIVMMDDFIYSEPEALK